jgi:hypothetical protein
MGSIKTFIYLIITTLFVLLYIYFLYQNINTPVHNDLLVAHLEDLQNQKIKIEAQIEKMTQEVVEKVCQSDEMQAFIADLTLTIRDQKLALIILGVFSVGCIALIALTYINSPSGLNAPASLGNLIDVGQTGFTGLLNAHIENTRMLTVLQIKSQQMNTSIFTLIESVNVLKEEVTVLSLSIKANQSQLQHFFSLLQSTQS